MAEKPIIYVGRSSSKLGKAVVEELGITQGDLDFMDFPDGEPWFCANDADRIEGKPVFIIQSTSQYAPKAYFDLFGILEAVVRCNPRRVIVFMPFMGFRRQERQKEKGEAVMAEQMAKFVAVAGATDVVLCDPHAPALIEYFEKYKVRTHVIDANPLFWQVLNGLDLREYVVLTPDLGREDVASKFANYLGIPLVQASKTRFDGESTQTNGVQGNVKDKHIIFRDDEVSTAGTLIETINYIMESGALDITVMATHGVLVGGSIQKFKRKKAIIKKVYVTDSVYLANEKRLDNIEIISLGPTIARMILNMMKES